MNRIGDWLYAFGEALIRFAQTRWGTAFLVLLIAVCIVAITHYGFGWNVK